MKAEPNEDRFKRDAEVIYCNEIRWNYAYQNTRGKYQYLCRILQLAKYVHIYEPI